MRDRPTPSLDRRLFLAGAAALAAAPRVMAAEADIAPRAFTDAALGRPLPYIAHSTAGVGPGSPIVYLLHGHGGSEWSWVRAGAALETAEALVATGELPPLHLVLPGVGNSWYVDSERHGPVATTLLDGLMPALEAELAVDTDRRGLIGLSMGGFGTLHLGLREPERFRLLGALSPAVFEPDAAFPDIQLNLFAGAFGEPFDPSLFAAADPFNRIPLAAAAARPPHFYLAAGADDYFGLEIGTFAFYRALDEAGVTAQVRILDGQHDWAFWRDQLPATLRRFAAAIAA